MKMDKVRDIRNYVLKGDKADTEDREKCSEERALYAETRDGQQKEDWHCDSPYTMGDGAATLLWIISIVDTAHIIHLSLNNAPATIEIIHSKVAAPSPIV